MNLFYSPSLNELSTLLGKYEDINSNFNLIVDHDGEVFLEANSNEAKKLLRKYKFYMHGIKKNVSDNLLQLNQLYKNLVYCWEKGLNGKVNYEKISRIENLSHWMEISNFSEETGKRIISVFFNRKRFDSSSLA